MTKEIFISEIGCVKVTKKRGLKRMTLSVKASGEVKMSIPYIVSFSSAEKFILEKKEWIIKSRKKIAEKQKQNTIFTPETVFSTKKHKLVFIQNEKPKIIISNSEIKVYYPDKKIFENERFQEYIKTGIIETLRAEAKEYLPQRTELLAKKFGFNFEKVSVRNAKTRWGSCSGKNNISLNIHLMRLPEHLSDHVILHELCHTVEKNHGRKFWALLDKVSGNAEKLDKELKNYNPAVF